MRLRTTVVLGTASLIATSAIAATSPARLSALRSDPVPIRGGIQIPSGRLIHVFQPGPDSVGGMGTRIEPSTMTDFKGYVAAGFLRGTATDRGGTSYDAIVDIRVIQGEYVGADGRHHDGTFGFVSIDLFQAGTGSKVQLHAFHASNSRSGPFWTVRIPDDALELGVGSARLRVMDLDVVDSFTFMGPNEVPARVSFDLAFVARGRSVRHRPDAHDPIDASNFDAEFHEATATGTFSGRAPGFRFSGAGSSAGGFAEMGRERNGVFLFEREEFIIPVDLFDEEGFPGEIDLANATRNPDPKRDPLAARSAERCALSVDPLDLYRSKVVGGAAGRPSADRGPTLGSLRAATYRKVSPGVYLMQPQADRVRAARITLLH